MNIVQINQTADFGSTGKIMHELNDIINSSGHKGFMVSGYANNYNEANLKCANLGSPLYSSRKDQLIFRFSGENGYRYKKRSLKIIEWIDNVRPDIIHLHNIHGDWLHIETLFKYIREKEIPVVWTLHDCWAFTGRCSHFEQIHCDKWKTQCHHCKSKKVYPITYLFDKSRQMFEDKKRWFTGINNVNIVAPSRWLADYIRQSFLGEYPIKVIPNGINTNVFAVQKIRSKYYKAISKKYIILGVASSWSGGKGFNDFLKLNKIIDHHRYQIVMVGLNKKQMKMLPDTIIGIERTNNQKELAELYSGADCYLNCSVLETMGMTTIEAMSCGTPVIAYNRTAIPETVGENCGIIIDDISMEAVYNAIQKICASKNAYLKSCRENVLLNYDKKRFYEYIDMYTEICGLN